MGQGLRPDKPGCWWWEDVEGILHVAEFDEEIETKIGSGGWYNPIAFEQRSLFKRWVGPAHPPKPLTRLDVDADGDIGHSKHGYLVRYEDVKEYDSNAT